MQRNWLVHVPTSFALKVNGWSLGKIRINSHLHEPKPTLVVLKVQIKVKFFTMRAPEGIVASRERNFWSTSIAKRLMKPLRININKNLFRFSQQNLRVFSGLFTTASRKIQVCVRHYGWMINFIRIFTIRIEHQWLEAPIFLFCYIIWWFV